MLLYLFILHCGRCRIGLHPILGIIIAIHELINKLFIIFADSQMTAVQILLLPQFMQMKRHQRVLHLLFLSLRF